MTTLSDTYLHKSLREIGFTTHEAAIYLACLEKGESSIMSLSSSTGIHRTTIYGIVDELVQKGYLRFIQHGSHRIYAAETPEKLRDIIDQIKARTERREAFLQSVLPTLRMKFSDSPRKPKVAYFQGQKEVRQIYQNMLDSNAVEVLFVGEAATIEQAVGVEYLQEVINKRIAIKMKARGIRTKQTEVGESLYENKNKYLRTIRYAPTGFQMPTYIGIYANKVFFISSIIESYGIEVESKDLVLTMRNWFEALWIVSKPVKS